MQEGLYAQAGQGKGKNKGKRVSKCVKKKKKAVPVLPTTIGGGVFAGGAGPTELRILFGYDSETKPDEDGDGVSVRLTMPAGAMSCTSPGGAKVPNDQPLRGNWDGTIVSKKTGTFKGSESAFAVTRSMQGRFLPKKRIQVTVAISGASAGSGRACSGSATRDVSYTGQPAGSFGSP